MSGYETKWVSGEHNVVCAICQAYFKSSKVKPNWQGLLVCPQDLDPDPRVDVLAKLPIYNDPRPVQEVQGPETIKFSPTNPNLDTQALDPNNLGRHD